MSVTPNVPTNFLVVPGPGVGQVNLSWNIVEITGVTITSYTIVVYNGPTLVGEITTTDTKTNKILGSGNSLVEGTTYNFAVRTNAGPEFSAYTSHLTMTPPTADPFPNAPTLTIPPNQPAGQVSLSWTIVPKSNVTITSYTINGTNLTSSTPLDSITATNSATAAVLGLSDGIVGGNSYSFTIRANVGPLEGPPSNIQTVNTTAVTVPCYARGTLILTDKGYIKIEDIKKGDKVVREGSISKKGVLEKNKIKEVPVIWVSKFKIKKLDSLSRPICIGKNAFGEDRPFENLYVSPGHSIMIDDRLITAKNLRNGDTIYPYDECESVEYYHLQCEAHSAIYANGVLSETYIEWRKEFFNVINYLE